MTHNTDTDTDTDTDSITPPETPYRERPYRNEEWLREQYSDNQNTQSEIADDCGVDISTISRWLDRHGIQKRTRREAQAAARSLSDTYQNENWLRDQHITQEKSAPEIGDECDVTPATIHNWLDKYDIERRTPGEDTYRDADWLREQYVDKKRTQYEIADECGRSQSTIRRWLTNFDIDTRDHSEARLTGTSGTAPYRDQEWLREQYVEKQRPEHEIADECDVSRETIHRWIVTHKIPPQ